MFYNSYNGSLRYKSYSVVTKKMKPDHCNQKLVLFTDETIPTLGP